MIFSVLFVCFANICRSPMAESIFKSAIKERNLENQWIVDSCSLSNYFSGELPDSRALTVLRKHGLNSDHISRPITDEDFDKFDYIFAMDRYIYNLLMERKSKIKRETKSKVELLGKYYPLGLRYIQDPYFDNPNDLSGYEDCFDTSEKSIKVFLDKWMIDKK